MRLIFIICTMVLLPRQTDARFFHGDIKYELELFMQLEFGKGVASFVDSSVVCEYQNIRSVKNKPDLEKLMDRFFAENKYKSFTISNQGTYKNMTRHMEGIYESFNKKKFNVYFEALYDEVEAHHHLSRMVIERIDNN